MKLSIMASKHQRGDSFRSSRAYDHNRFTSVEASKHFYNVLAGKSFVLERGLRPDETQDGDIGMMVVERN